MFWMLWIGFDKDWFLFTRIHVPKEQPKKPKVNRLSRMTELVNTFTFVMATKSQVSSFLASL